MYKIGFIGMGNMASALMTGIVKSGYLKAEEICGADISEQACMNAKKRGHMVFENNHEVIKHSNLVIIAVKPQVLEGVIGEVHDDLKNKAVMSIALGYDFEKYEKLLDASTRHLTIMPNTPVEVCEGMLLLEAKHSLKEDEYQFIVDMLNHIGSTEVLPSHLMNVGGYSFSIIQQNYSLVLSSDIKRSSSGWKYSSILPTAPWRCLATSSSVI